MDTIHSSSKQSTSSTFEGLALLWITFFATSIGMKPIRRETVPRMLMVTIFVVSRSILRFAQWHFKSEKRRATMQLLYSFVRRVNHPEWCPVSLFISGSLGFPLFAVVNYKHTVDHSHICIWPICWNEKLRKKNVLKKNVLKKNHCFKRCIWFPG